ncbi:MAG: hypothetical protein JW786_13200 [Desulfobacterales bacterium]|nr:hypothetical protein [Desulfobacterales bacterium]
MHIKLKLFIMISLTLILFTGLAYADGEPKGMALDDKHFVVICDLGRYREFNQIIYLYETDGNRIQIKDAVYVTQVPAGLNVTADTKIISQRLKIDNIQTELTQ